MIKSQVRERAREHRRSLSRPDVGPALVQHFPKRFTQNPIAGFSPIGDEIDIWPLLASLKRAGRQITLPVVLGPKLPLVFRVWTPGCDMEKDRYGISFPVKGAPVSPQLVFVPLLAFTGRGDRLGYGGGYFDRTLTALRRSGEVFACGVAYAGQEVAELPTDAHDAKLDGILTEDGFRIFA